MTAPLLLEIGCEELPAGVVGPAAEALRAAVVAALDEAAIAHGEAIWLGTPRRLTVHVLNVALEQPDRTETLTGPPLRAAKNPAGEWTQAALGFAKGQGVDLSALYELETPKGPYLAAQRTLPGRPTEQLLAEKLPEILRTLPFPKRMRWAARPETFARPIHWLVALLGQTQVQTEYAGVQTGRQSRGHRFYHPQPLDVTADLDAYKSTLWQAKVMVDPAERRRVILRGIQQLAAEANGLWHEDPETLDTVVQLVEWPAPLLGTFAAEFLEIPAPVIRTTLRENQKLFTLTAKDGALLPHFIAVANTLSEESRAVVAKGNTRVVSARLADARFFVQEDTKTTLESKLPELQKRLYLQGLPKNTLADKVERIRDVATKLASQLAPDAEAHTRRAAELCKADLATRMVFEFPELQGFVGADYARRDGEDPQVVQAIAQHYQPRFGGDALPDEPVGQLVALADKLDALASCFVLGLTPTGTQDPYALRRAALGVLRLLAETNLGISLGKATTLAVQAITEIPPKSDAHDEQILEQLRLFFRGRLLSMHTQEFPTDLVEAVLEAGFDNVASVRPRLLALDSLRQTDGFAPLAAAFKRASNIVQKQGGELPADFEVNPATLTVQAEQTLHTTMAAIRSQVAAAIQEADYPQACQHLVALKPAVDAFFDQVMVMADDVQVRLNRLALLRDCTKMFAPLADFARIQG